MGRRGRRAELQHKRLLIALGLLLAVVAIFGMTYIETFIGMVSMEGIAGTITAVNLLVGSPSTLYQGYYGLAIQVNNVSVDLTETAQGGEISRKDLIMSCIPSSGTEIYVSTRPQADLDLENISAATIADIVAAFNLSQYNGFDHPNYTYTDNVSITLGNTTISTIGVTTFKNDAAVGSPFTTAVLLDGNGLVFFGAKRQNFQSGFDGQTVNYQLMLPVSNLSSTTHYFFTDPYDECPFGPGAVLYNGSIHGFTSEDQGGGILVTVPNVTISIASAFFLSNSTGEYLSGVPEGTYTLIAVKDGYAPYLASNITILPGNVTEHNITLVRSGEGSVFGNVTIYGKVLDNSTLLALENATVSIGGELTLTNSSGGYRIITSGGPLTAVGFKAGYLPYVTNFTLSTGQILELNMNLSRAEEAGLGAGAGVGLGAGLGPGQGPGQGAGLGQGQGVGTGIERRIERPGQLNQYITKDKITRKLRQETFSVDELGFINVGPDPITIGLQVEGNVSHLVRLSEQAFVLHSNESRSLFVTLLGLDDPGVYRGNLLVSGGINTTIPIELTILPKDKLPINAMVMKLEMADPIVHPGGSVDFRIDLRNLLIDVSYPVSLSFFMEDENGSQRSLLGEDRIMLETFTSLLESFPINESTPLGAYTLVAEASYLNISSNAVEVFEIRERFYMQTLFGIIRVWQLVAGLFGIGVMVFLFVLYRRHQEAKKRFHAKTDTKALPKPGPRSLYTGKIAETNTKAYLDMDTLTVHTIIAGSTGGGKTIAAQDIIEEALDKNINIAVFDPTAQWTGMLRPLKDKKMLSHYPQFDMNKKQAKAYPGNITQITNPYTKINLLQKLQPGTIQIYTLNTLDPKDIDTFVANTVREIFHQNLKEQRQLTTLLVYDEVHRLLPKFGGSGEGFIQIERACREFRKWGLGVVLVSQVLADFVGQIKANINTEIQMKTRDEGDLERIKTKFGTNYIQSLVKAPVGSGMIQNSNYNHGKPYYITFRPIKHSVQRLTDQELQQYTKYNQQTEQLQYELEQLKQHNIDTFDTQLELNLAKQKIQQGQFNIAQIYTETIQQTNQKHFQQLHIQPQQKQQETINKEELEQEIQKAKEEHSEAEKEVEQQEKQEKKKEEETPLFKKTLPLSEALTYANGQTATSLEEVMDIIKSMSPQVFIQHHTEKKNDTADWVDKRFSQTGMADEIRKVRSRKDLLNVLAGWKKKGVMVKEMSPTQTEQPPASGELSPQPTPSQQTPSQQTPSQQTPPERTPPEQASSGQEEKKEKDEKDEKEEKEEKEGDVEKPEADDAPGKAAFDRFEELARYMEQKIKEGEKEDARKVYDDLRRCYHDMSPEEKRRAMQEGMNIVEMLKAAS